MVTPTASASFGVSGTNTFGCVKTSTLAITVNSIVVSVSASRSTICTGETTTLTASGASTYSWLPNGSGGSSLVINGVIAGNLTYVVTGYDSKGCSNDSTVSVNVSKCTGIASVANSGSGVKVYPNPNAGEFTVELDNGLNKSIEVTDLTGRVILVSTTKEDKATINISTFAKGVYYVKVQSNNSVEVIKVIKQ